MTLNQVKDTKTGRVRRQLSFTVSTTHKTRTLSCKAVLKHAAMIICRHGEPFATYVCHDRPDEHWWRY